MTPFSYAGWYGQVEIARLLLARDDVEADSKNEEGRTPLSFAAWYGKLQFKAAKNGCVPLLSTEDIDVNLQDKYGDSPLHYAVRYGHQNVASLLLLHCNIAPNLKNVKGQTPLHCAVLGVDGEYDVNYNSASSREATVSLLLARNDVRVGLEDDNGLTTLMLACSLEIASVVKLF
ncbi:hypothetical protein SERLA73DRAFT_192006 [Serpula lacrymans var. lacrymans S7.3]|uniref:Uncharacterized protein n=2 Tax=Serpula lacrymans var. lacrymans TaxID=341189 RepID=F8QIS3_SERL3|nr:uncharacterized protein SERLADRAFT_479100 [Serpula lacrymans var. lacrymans S7.9]EGN91795.1 hypothetical protein SERLA73DRAFT_192006 [Serpula lacrymans var. lacrymans S7.3]EGO19547.1 hypothetical protein SERLADRAFT_479100 [Serpula lacrymans var. lacrymans S7.9]